MNPNTQTDQRGRIGRIEALIEEIERFADPAAQARTREIVQVLLDFHGEAVARLVDHIEAAGPPGRAVLENLANDQQVASLLLLYSLHPHSLEERVAKALESVRPQLRGHGGDVELIGLDEGVVRLRLKGSCHGCPSSSATLTNLVEAAVYDAAPDVATIELEGALEPVNNLMLPVLNLSPTIIGDGLRRAGPA